MVKLKTIFWLVDVITFFLTCGLATTIAGAFQAWLAKKMGDSTAYFAGYLTLNPFVHIDWLGLFCFCVLGIGWDKMIPIDITAITGPLRKFKIALIESGTWIAYFSIAFLGTALLRIFAGYRFMSIMYKTSLYALSFAHFSLETKPLLNATGVVLSYLIVATIGVSLILGGFDFIRLVVTWIFRLLQQNRSISLEPETHLYINIITLLVAIFVLFPLKFMVMFIIAQASMPMIGLLGL